MLLIETEEFALVSVVHQHVVSIGAESRLHHKNLSPFGFDCGSFLESKLFRNQTNFLSQSKRTSSQSISLLKSDAFITFNIKRTSQSYNTLTLKMKMYA